MYTPKTSFEKCNLMLDLAAQRQRALSSNIVNMDTPGYVRRDIDFAQYLGTMNSPLETELSSKLGASGVVTEKQGKVDVVYELTEMQKNALTYATAIKRMNSAISQIRTVINVGS